jgi:hypothetical protein
MKQTDGEADEALAHIRRTTAAPIQRFLDAIAASRLEEMTGRRDGVENGPSRHVCLDVLQGLHRLSKGLGNSLKEAPGTKPLARVIRRICLWR